MDNKDIRFTLSNRATTSTLNPNAAEFIPSARRSTIINTRTADATKLVVPGASDEVHQYWRRQLPNDITPNFKFVVQDELRGHERLSLAGSSIHDGIGTSQLSSVAARETLSIQQDTSSLVGNNFSSNEQSGYSSSTYAANYSPSSILTSSANSWNKQFVNSDQYFMNEREGLQYNRDPHAILNDSLRSDTLATVLKFLEAKFLVFSAESIADVFFANRCDLNSTINILTQLENREGYLTGEKAEEPLHNMKMKEGHGKARETIYHQRNPVASERQDYLRGLDHIIDLQGLPVREATQVLKQELSTLKSNAKSAGKRLQVMIRVGTGHHTEGVRTPAWLPVAVEQYLVDEGLHFTQPQPGLLCVVI